MSLDIEDGDAAERQKQIRQLGPEDTLGPLTSMTRDSTTLVTDMITKSSLVESELVFKKKEFEAAWED